jgi:hypothetical protein
MPGITPVPPAFRFAIIFFSRVTSSFSAFFDALLVIVFTREAYTSEVYSSKRGNTARHNDSQTQRVTLLRKQC